MPAAVSTKGTCRIAIVVAPEKEAKCDKIKVLLETFVYSCLYSLLPKEGGLE